MHRRILGVVVASMIVAAPVGTAFADSVGGLLGAFEALARQSGGGREVPPPPGYEGRAKSPSRSEKRAAKQAEAMPQEMRAAIQQQLAALGFYSGPYDGVLGKGSREAIARYQQSIGAKPTGQLTKSQVQTLLATAEGRPTPATGDTAPEGATAAAEPPAGVGPAGGSAPDIPGLVVRNGAIMLAPASTMNPWANLVSPDPELLELALILKANPTLLDDPDATIAFVRLVGEDERARFALQTYGNDYAFIGKNQFEVEDARLGFIDAYRRKMELMAPSLPLLINDIRGIQFGDYDAATGALEIEISNPNGGPWSLPRRLAFEAPMPFSPPRQWMLPRAEARRIIEAAAAADGDSHQLMSGHVSHPAATAVLRYAIRDVRPIKLGAALDLVAIGIDVYAGLTLDTKIGSIPLPPDAVTEASDAASTGLPVLDPLLPRVLVAKQSPQLLDNAAFVAETFRLRREMERRAKAGMVENALAETYRWPLGVSTLSLKTDLPATPEELAATRAFLAEAIKADFGTIEQARICQYLGNDSSSKTCRITQTAKVLDDGALVLSDLAVPTVDWGFARAYGEWREAALAEVAAQLPDNARLIDFPSGGDLPTILALSPNPAWFGVDLPFRQQDLVSAGLELAVDKVSVQHPGESNSYLLIEISPRAIRYRPPGGSAQRFAFTAAPPAAATPATATVALGTFDILGAKLGMPIDDAVAAVTASMDGAELPRTEETRPGNVMFEHAVRLTLRKDGDGDDVDFIKLFYDAALPSKPVVAIGREILLEDLNFSGDDAAFAAISAPLMQKYGKGGRDYAREAHLYWATSPTTKARLKQTIRYDDPCADTNYRNFMGGESDNSPFGVDPKLRQRCGEVLSARISRHVVDTFLINTDVFPAMMARVLAAQPPAPAKKALKF